MKLYINKTLIFLALIALLNISCDDKDDETISIELVSGATLDLGDVPAGSTGIGSFAVKGIGLNLPIFLEIESDQFSLDKDLFPAANINNTANVLFSPSRTATREPVSTTVMLTSGGRTETINVMANIVKPQPLAIGTQVYFNNMEFGLEHGDPVSSSNFDSSSTIDATVLFTHSVSPSGGDASRVRTNKTSSMCADNSIGDCGNALRVVGNGTSVTVSLTGLEADRSYEVSYWVRPGGSSDRSLDVTVTGDTAPVFEDWGGFSDRSFYRKVVRTGIADSSGNIEINFEYSGSSTARTISIDDLEVVAL